jgi:hypothetical protein
MLIRQLEIADRPGILENPHPIEARETRSEYRDGKHRKQNADGDAAPQRKANRQSATNCGA